MKNILLLLTVGLFSLASFGQTTGKNGYFAKKITISDPTTDKRESFDRDTKITIDYDLKVIKVNFLKEEWVYSYHNIEQRMIDNKKIFFELDKGKISRL